MTLNRLKSVRTSTQSSDNSQKINLQPITNKALFKFSRAHPPIIIGEIQPLVLLEKYNINSQDKYYILSSVSHNIKNHQVSAEALDSNSQMSMNFFVISEKELEKNIKKYENIFIKDRGIDTNQEEKSIAIIQREQSLNSNFIVEILDDNTGNTIKTTLSGNDFKAYGTRKEKANALSSITKQIYDDVTGNHLGSIIPPVKSLVVTQAVPMKELVQQSISAKLPVNNSTPIE